VSFGSVSQALEEAEGGDVKGGGEEPVMENSGFSRWHPLL